MYAFTLPFCGVKVELKIKNKGKMMIRRSDSRSFFLIFPLNPEILNETQICRNVIGFLRAKIMISAFGLVQCEWN